MRDFKVILAFQRLRSSIADEIHTFRNHELTEADNFRYSDIITQFGLLMYDLHNEELDYILDVTYDFANLSVESFSDMCDSVILWLRHDCSMEYFPEEYRDRLEYIPSYTTLEYNRDLPHYDKNFYDAWVTLYQLFSYPTKATLQMLPGLEEECVAKWVDNDDECP